MIALKNHKSWDVLHCRRDSALGEIIDSVTDSDNNITGKRITHTALFINIFNVPFIIDSQADGTRLRSYKKWRERYGYDYLITRKISCDTKSEYLMSQVETYINAKYGVWDLFRHLIRRWTKKITKSGNGIWLGAKRSDKNLTCSEFVMRVFGNLDAYKASPRDAFEWCMSNEFELISK
jgi:hypothetical protein